MEWKLLVITMLIFFIANFTWAKINNLDFIEESKKQAQILPLLPHIIVAAFIFYFVLGNLGFWSCIGHWFLAALIYSLLVR
jgi:Ca2+/Na+ antiporter